MEFSAGLIDKIEEKFGKVVTWGLLASIVFFVPVLIFAKTLDVALNAKEALLTAIGFEYVIEFAKFYGIISLGFLFTYFLISFVVDVYFSRRWKALRKTHSEQIDKEHEYMLEKRKEIEDLLEKLDESMVDHENMVAETKRWHSMVRDGLSQLDLKKAELEAMEKGASVDILQGILHKGTGKGDR